MNRGFDVEVAIDRPIAEFDLKSVETFAVADRRDRSRFHSFAFDVRNDSSGIARLRRLRVRREEKRNRHQRYEGTPPHCVGGSNKIFAGMSSAELRVKSCSHGPAGRLISVVLLKT